MLLLGAVALAVAVAFAFAVAVAVAVAVADTFRIVTSCICACRSGLAWISFLSSQERSIVKQVWKLFQLGRGMDRVREFIGS